MQTRRVGEFDVSAIGFGCMSLSGAYGRPPGWGNAERVLKGALDAGYTFFDTAVAYGMGRNEALIGKHLRKRRHEFVLASKCGLTNGDRRELTGDPAVLKATCDDSLRRLKTDVIDLYYLHRWDRRVPIEDSIGALADLKRAGKIRAIGVSEISAATLRRAHAEHPIAALQTEYSPWTRNPELGVLDACRELGVGFVAFSPVGRGFLAGGVRSLSRIKAGDLRKGMPRFEGEAFQANLTMLRTFEALARDAGCTPAQLCLAWLLRKGGDIVPIPGTASFAHMRENAAAAAIALSDDIMAGVDAAGRAVTGSRYPDHLQASVDTERMPGE
ncbi:MAG: aldo/keto reductase [Phenylobacterium sp.]|uniref:aldo/keto reductase n=1 Tax=Phenylobacterium sp. TaxID=1871053 RepID=UPI0012171138|nr:aldo/keto reductase [Phenylobacterium sp.]TAL37643.1 MAG: aldo/keto reductase [Phenylobacterium sp.]